MKSKLFLSMSLLTALFSVNMYCETHASINGTTDYLEMIGAKAVHEGINGTTDYLDMIGSKVVTPTTTPVAAATTATTATSKVAQFTSHPITQHAALAAGTLVAGTAIAGATVYGAQKAYNYMYPKQEVQPTRFERVKSVLNNGYTAVKANAVKGYNLALENKGKTAGAVAAVAALGLVAYKYSDSIFGKSKVVAAPVAPVQKAPARVAYVRTLRD